MVYIAIGVVVKRYEFVQDELMAWLTKYLAVIFTLITGSTFFQKSFFDEQLRDVIYFRLAFVFSIFYLLFITEIVIIEPSRNDYESFDADKFIEKLNQSGQILNFVLPTLIAFLSYFFYKNKVAKDVEKQEAGK